MSGAIDLFWAGLAATLALLTDIWRWLNAHEAAVWAVIAFLVIRARLVRIENQVNQLYVMLAPPPG